MSADLLLTAEELVTVSGGYRQPAKQLAELKLQGYWRARRSKITGHVILERAHFEAVCAGADLQPGSHGRKAEPEPTLYA